MSSGEPKTKKQKLDPATASVDSSESGDGAGVDKQKALVHDTKENAVTLLREQLAADETQKALEAIDSIQTEIDLLNEQASEEILEVEKKYNVLRRPFLDKRNAIIERIPNFWATSLLNHPQIAGVVNQKDKECLQYLKKVEVEESEDIKSGYKLRFNFKTNPFFTNEVLCKEFHLAQTGDPESKSTAIDWKEGMDLAKCGEGKKRRGIHDSFFIWFQDNADAAVDGIAEVIKDDMWPNPLHYYLASGRDDENGMDDSDEDDDDLDEEEDEDLDESVVVVEDDDDDEEEDEEVYEIDDDQDYEDELDTTGDVEVIEEDEVAVEELDDVEEVEEINDSREENDFSDSKEENDVNDSKEEEAPDKDVASGDAKDSTEDKTKDE